MLKYLQNAFKITNENVIVAVPLLIFYILINLYLGYTKYMADTPLEALIAMLTITFMVAVFLAGWFYMIKKAVDLSKKIFVLDDEAAKAHLGLIKEFPAGVGKYFLTFIVFFVIFIILVILLSAFIFTLGINFIGKIDFTPEQINMLTSSTKGLLNFVETMPIEQYILLAKWNFLLMGASFVFSYLLMFWIPEIIYTDRNPLIALFTGIGKLFKKPLKSLYLFVILTVINFILSFIMTFTLLFPVLYFVMATVYLYYIIYVLMLIFSYYDGEFIKENEEN